VITSVERRRRWSRAEKERIVAASMEPGAVASAVAREAGIHASQLYRWRQELCGPARATPDFAAVTIAPEPGVGASPVIATSHSLIEIELPTGARLRIAEVLGSVGFRA
jgi:transposase